jgi:hypothetical protein
LNGVFNEDSVFLFIALQKTGSLPVELMREKHDALPHLNSGAYMIKAPTLIAIAAGITMTACSTSEVVSPTRQNVLAPGLAKSTVVDPATSWLLPVADAALGLRSDHAQADATYSAYSDGDCGVTGRIFLGGSGDATLQTNNPRVKNQQCLGPRKMTLVYPIGDPSYPAGGSETMPVFLNLRNIANSTTTIGVGYSNRVTRMLSLNPTQAERCDAWRWTDDGQAGDKVWVERVDATTYHVYTQDLDPVEANRVSGANRAVCTTTGQSHHLSVDLYIVSKTALP